MRSHRLPSWARLLLPEAPQSLILAKLLQAGSCMTTFQHRGWSLGVQPAPEGNRDSRWLNYCCFGTYWDHSQIQQRQGVLSIYLFFFNYIKTDIVLYMYKFPIRNGDKSCWITKGVPVRCHWWWICGTGFNEDIGMSYRTAINSNFFSYQVSSAVSYVCCRLPVRCGW